jgi:MYXO-CTERM domain-containing protein
MSHTHLSTFNKLGATLATALAVVTIGSARVGAQTQTADTTGRTVAPATTAGTQGVTERMPEQHRNYGWLGLFGLAGLLGLRRNEPTVVRHERDRDMASNLGTGR